MSSCCTAALDTDLDLLGVCSKNPKECASSHHCTDHQAKMGNLWSRLLCSEILFCQCCSLEIGATKCSCTHIGSVTPPSPMISICLCGACSLEHTADHSACGTNIKSLHAVSDSRARREALTDIYPITRIVQAVPLNYTLAFLFSHRLACSALETVLERSE